MLLCVFCGVDSICRWIAWLFDLSFVTFDWWLVVVDSGVVFSCRWVAFCWISWLPAC